MGILSNGLIVPFVLLPKKIKMKQNSGEGSDATRIHEIGLSPKGRHITVKIEIELALVGFHNPVPLLLANSRNQDITRFMYYQGIIF